MSAPQNAGAALDVVAMSKHFGANLALQAVDMHVPANSFHALLGENGAGKSTLVKCIMGTYRADEGKMLLDGAPVKIDGPRSALELGLGMVYQQFTLVPGMTVAENMVLTRPHVPAVVNWAREKRELAAFMSRMPFSVPLDRRVSTLSAGEKQKVEILKLIHLGCRFLILDEPTAVLTPGEADEVLGFLRERVQSGRLTVLLISHKFREVTAYADAVTILRRGRSAGSGATAELGVAEMARMMVGGDVPAVRTDRSPREPGAAVLEIAELRADRDDGIAALNGVSVAVRSGEIVGIAGVSGNGQSELVAVLAGQRPATAGTVRVHGQKYDGTRAQTERHRLRCMPEEPLRNAGVGRMTMAENLALRRFDRPPLVAGRWWQRRAAVRDEARARITDYNIRPPLPDADLASLSGGNVQRTILARELFGDVDVLIVSNPCVGLDFGATAEIRARILAARNRGAAVLLVSDDLDEVRELSDRILVMSGGKIAYASDAANAAIGDIGAAMAGH